jgi:predicted ester cyclase
MTGVTTTRDGGASEADHAGRARGALERVCSGADPDAAGHYYSPQFVDHVNDLEHRGLAGVRQSVEMYRRALADLAVEVQDQVAHGDRVVSRFIVTGTCRGRRVRFAGITISRFEDGLIVEDWSVTDTLSLVRQLGAWRSILVGLGQWRAAGRAGRGQL